MLKRCSSCVAGIFEKCPNSVLQVFSTLFEYWDFSLFSLVESANRYQENFINLIGRLSEFLCLFRRIGLQLVRLF